jgi:uncharacterized metal-binding protein YceD (DUF177 family)
MNRRTPAKPSSAKASTKTASTKTASAKPSSTKPSPQAAWSVPVVVADIPETGRRLDLVADEGAREAIAKVAGLAALPRLEAGFDLTPQGADGLHVVGRVAATVVQNCVVTLEPIESHIDEAVDLIFLPDLTPAADPAGLQAHEADEPPEAMRDGVVDLGAVAIEFLLLGIDPYPRKPGAMFDAPPAGDPSSHPFAALAALKKGGNPKT